MFEEEQVSMKDYEDLLRDKSLHDKDNLILRKMLRKLGAPVRVVRLVVGLCGTRADVWPCGCMRQYHAGIGMLTPPKREEAKLCEQHKRLLAR